MGAYIIKNDLKDVRPYNTYLPRDWQLGKVVYDLRKPSYGGPDLPNGVLVSLRQDGDYPFFEVPDYALDRLKPVQED